MSKKKNGNLYEAFDLYVRRQDALLPDEETLSDITPSPAFTQRMQKLMQRQKYGFYVLFGTAGRRVASVLVALLLGMTVATFSVDALRESVAQFFTQVFETFTSVFFVNEEPEFSEVTMEKKNPAYLPEGYEVESETDMDIVYEIVYTNPKTGDIIRYNQQWLDNITAALDTEEIVYEEINVGNYQGIKYKNKDTFYIVFSDTLYTYRLSSAFVSVEELLQMAESIPVD